jgi:flagellar basal body-associated protein FliL
MELNMSRITKIGLSVILVAAPILAQPGPRRAQGAGAEVDALKTYLNLTDQQVQSLRDLQRSFMESNRTTLQQIAEKQRAVREEMQRPQPSAGVVGQLMVDSHSLRQQISTRRTELRTQARNLLNEEQKQKLAGLEQAQSLLAAIGQAARLNLIEGPAGFRERGIGAGHRGGPGAGLMGGPGRMMRRGPGARL